MSAQALNIFWNTFLYNYSNEIIYSIESINRMKSSSDFRSKCNDFFTDKWKILFSMELFVFWYFYSEKAPFKIS